MALKELVHIRADEQGISKDGENLIRDCATTVVNSLIGKDKVDTADTKTREIIEKAIDYECIFLIEEGGVAAALGETSQSTVTSVRIGAFSENYASSSAKNNSINGAPVSPMVIAILKENGLIGSRWAYHERYVKDGII